MADQTELIERLEAVEQRLAEHAAGPSPDGLTDPDEGGTERWEAAQVWAHMAEFVGFWQAELEKVVDHYEGTPVPFGRTKDDLDRAAAIEAGRTIPVPVLMERVHDGIEVVRRYLPTLSDAQWSSVGLHSRIGEMDVAYIVERFQLTHLEEHADQLDSLG
ncbi:MAG TPA: DinB family protein [Candidatus Limnocylindrales bacterium]|nr:DinB family protein [Candidatus Limnocylindrales bacterium]